MADLIVRMTSIDSALVIRLLQASRVDAESLHRVVVDAHTAASASGDAIASSARQAGLPMLVDPQTHYLQDYQHADDAWGRLLFADPPALDPSDLTVDRIDRLAATTVEFQMQHGATAVIAPYVHIERSDDGWLEVQLLLFRRLRRYLDTQHIRMPLIAPVAVSWRLLGRPTWQVGLELLMTGLHDLHPTEVALAASNVDQGAHPDRRLAELYAVIGHLRRHWPIIAWIQGVLGEACVAAGAAGYETGIGWRERCALRVRMAERRTPRATEGGGPGPRPVYISALGRSIPKRSVAALLDTQQPTVVADLVCQDPHCCPAGLQALLADTRIHTVTARASQLAVLAAAGHPRWAWNHLASRAATGLELARRINALAGTRPGITRVDTGALSAVAITAHVRRQTASAAYAA